MTLQSQDSRCLHQRDEMHEYELSYEAMLKHLKFNKEVTQMVHAT